MAFGIIILLVKRMNRVPLLLLASLLLVLNRIGTAEESPSAERRERIANELSKALNALGSFKAEYLLVAPGKPPAKAIVSFNHEQNYCMFNFAGIDKMETDFCSVLDLSGMQKESRSFEMLMIAGGKGTKFSLRLDEMLEHGDNVVGLLLFMCRQVFDGVKTNTDLNFVEPVVPTLSLGLGKTYLEAAAGFRMGTKGLEVSWLEPECITNAIEIVESPKSVQFVYRDNHVVSVDRLSGLLLKDSWPDAARPGPREIVLKSNSSFEPGVSYTSAIPEFDKIQIKDASSNPFYAQLTAQILAKLGQELSKEEDFEEMIRSYPSRGLAATRAAAQKFFSESVQAMVTKEKAIRYRDTVLLPGFGAFGRENPEQAKGISFEEFLDKVTARAEKSPSELVTPEALVVVNGLRQQFSDAVRELPADAQAKLQKLFDVTLPPIMEGLGLELFLQNVQQIKALRRSTPEK